MFSEEQIKLLDRYGFKQIEYSHFPDCWYAKNGSRWTEEEVRQYILKENLTEKK